MGAAQGVAQGYVQNINEEIATLKLEALEQAKETRRVAGRQSDADFETTQRGTAGTKQFDEAEGAKRKKDADEIALRTSRNKETEGLIQSGADHAQTASGDHLVRGDDGKVRRTDKDGNLLDGKGVDAKTFGMDAKDKIELSTAELRNTAAKLAVADHGKDKTKAKQRRKSLRMLTRPMASTCATRPRIQKAATTSRSTLKPQESWGLAAILKRWRRRYWGRSRKVP